MEMYLSCPKCGGTGKLKHRCGDSGFNILSNIKLREDETGFDATVIKRCLLCGGLYKVRSVYDAVAKSGKATTLGVGETKNGYTFTAEEAAKYTS